MKKLNQTSIETKQAIELHLRLDEKQGKTNRDAWPQALKELYEQRGGDVDEQSDET